MDELTNYWTRTRGAIGRRRLLQAAGAGVALTAFGAACRGNSNNARPATTAPTAANGAPGTPQAAAPSAKTNLGTPPTVKQPKRGGSLTVRGSDPPNISPFTAAAAVPQSFGIAYNKLLRIKSGIDLDPADVTLEPDLAQSLPEQPDALTYIYKLRPGIKFHDVAPANGRDLKVDDVKADIEAYRSDTRSAFRADNSVIKSVETPDAQTVKVTLSQPSAPLLVTSSSGYGWRIFPREMLDGDDLKTKAVGTGPFILESYQVNSQAQWNRNPTYFRQGLPYFNRITFAIIPQDPSAISALEAGQISAASQIDTTSTQALKAKGLRYQQSFDSFPGGYIAMDTTQPPFNDVRVRRALSLAFDRSTEIKTLEGGEGRPDQLVPVGAYKPALPIDQLGDAAKYWQFSTAEAKNLMSAAGYAGGIDTTIAWTPQYGTAYQSSIERALPELAAAGFRAKTQSYQYPDWIGGIYRPPFNFPGLLWGPYRYYPDIDPFVWFWLHPDQKEGIANQSRVNDPTLTALLEKQRTTLDTKARIEVIHDIQRLVADQQYYVGRTTGAAYTMWASWLEGWSGTLSYDWNFIESAWDSRL